MFTAFDPAVGTNRHTVGGRSAPTTRGWTEAERPVGHWAAVTRGEISVPSQVTPASPVVRPYPVAGAPLLCDAQDHGLTGNGTTNDQPALAALVDQLGDAFAADGRARVIYCPPG